MRTMACCLLLVLAVGLLAPAGALGRSDLYMVKARAGQDLYAVKARAGQDMEPAAFPSLLSVIRNIGGDLAFCGESVPLDDPSVRESLEKELLLILWNRAQMILYIKRSGRYFPYIESMLEQAGMPSDLKYLAVIESALKPHAGSSAGAVGYWQFIRPTGLKYGLRIDSDIDERRNLYTSTRAALDYLGELKEMFGSWTLAAAAYNMGESGLQKRIETQETEDYYHLSLPLETEDYVFRALAVKIIMSDPASFGFHFTDADLYKPLEFDEVTLTAPYDIPLQLVAKAAGTYFKTIKDLNPHLLGDELAQGTYTILLPEGAGDGFPARFQALLKDQPPQKSEYSVYTVRPGDTLLGIAAKAGIPVQSLLQHNGLTMKSKIHPGQKLIIAP